MLVKQAKPQLKLLVQNSMKNNISNFKLEKLTSS